MYLKKELYELIRTDKSIFDFIQESSFDGLWYWDLENPENEWMNEKFWTVLGYDPAEMPHKSSAWQSIINHDDLKVALDNFTKHCENPNHPYDQIVRYKHKNGSTVWIRCRGLAIRDKKGKPIRMLGAHHDITEHKESTEALQQIEWMLSGRKVKNENSVPEYGDLGKLNKNGLIISSVGNKQLIEIASEYLDLLETSSAIYEKNGDYAMGLFSSNWCKMMDSASRKLCKTKSNEEALNCGKWHCHESCWRDASLEAIESGKPADVECKGGIRLFAVPIYANGEVIGAINFGYGEPPKTDDELQKLSVLYKVPVKELKKAREEYKVRPQFIIDYAKKRIQASAQYIGNLIERQQAEEAEAEITQRLRLANRATNDVIWDWDVINDTQQWNEAGIKVFGWTEIVEHPVNANWWVDRVHPEDKDRVHNTFFSVVNNSELDTWHDEYRFLKADGTYAYVMDRGFVLRDRKGKAVRMIGAMLDITGRKKSELLLQEKSEEIAAQNEELNQANLELKKAIENTEESEKRYALVIDATEHGIWDWNVETDEIFYSEQWKRQIGYEKNELENKFSTWVEHLHPDEREACLNAVQEYLNNPEKHFYLEFRFRHKDGSYRWIYNKASSIKNKDGKVVRVFGAHTDISARKKAEIAQRESDEKFSIAFQTSQFAITITRANDGKFIEVNDMFITMTGFTREETLNNSSIGLKVWSNIEDRNFVVNELNSGRTVVEKEYEFRRKDNTTFFGSFSAKVIILKGEICILSSIMDITERKQAEEARKQSDRQFEQLIETLPISLGIVTVSGKILYINPKCRELFDAEKNSDNDKALFYWVNPEDRQKWLEEMKEKGSVKNFEMHMKNTAGKEIWALGSGIFVQYENQACVLSTHHDISELKAAEEALSMKMQELERFNTLMVGREITMIELKKEINSLLIKSGREAKYKIVE